MVTIIEIKMAVIIYQFLFVKFVSLNKIVDFLFDDLTSIKSMHCRPMSSALLKFVCLTEFACKFYFTNFHCPLYIYFGSSHIILYNVRKYMFDYSTLPFLCPPLFAIQRPIQVQSIYTITLKMSKFTLFRFIFSS